MVDALEFGWYAGAIVLLGPPVLAIWPAVRSRLVATDTPVLVLSPLAVEPFRLLALDRDLRLVALHIVGIEDHPHDMRQSLDHLLNDGVLRRFLRHFGAEAGALEMLVLPLWKTLGSIRSIQEWAALMGHNSDGLCRELRALGVRSPRRLLIWLRLLSAWPMLRGGAAAASVALEVGYSAPPDFSRCTRRFVGLLPSAARSVPLDELIARAVSDLVA